MIGGAILRKEMRLSGRRRLGYVSRSLYLLLLLVVVSIAFSGSWASTFHHSGISQLESLQRIAPTLTLTILWFQFVVLSLAGPVMTGGAICDERRARTLATLATTPLSSLSIVVGKLASRFVHLLFGCLLAAPLLLALRVFGGVEAETIAAGMCLTLATGVMASAFALLGSAYARRAPSAILQGISLSAAVHLLPMMFTGILLATGLLNRPPQWIMVTCAPAVMMALSVPEFSSAVPTYTMTTLWVANVLYSLGFALLACLLASLRLRGILRREGEEARAVEAARTTARTRTIGDSPVLWRELRQRALPRTRWVAASILAMLALVGLFLAIDHEETRPVLAYSIASLGTVYLLAGAAIRAPLAISAEREARTWDVLLTTQLSAVEILAGKFLGHVRRLWPGPALLLIPLVLCLVLGDLHPFVLLHLAIIWFPPLIFLTASGLYFGLLCHRGIHASILNLTLALTLWAGTWVVVLLALLFFDAFGGPDDAVVDLASAINPVVMSNFAVSGGSRGWNGQFDFDYPIWSSIGPTGFTMIALVIGAAYLAAAGGFLLATKGLFPSRAGRVET